MLIFYEEIRDNFKMDNDKELQRLIREQMNDSYNTQYEDNIDDELRHRQDASEGLDAPKKQSFKRRYYKHGGGTSMLPITEKNERMMIHLSEINKPTKFPERVNIINVCTINIKNRLCGKLNDKSSIADDLEIIGDYLISIQEFIPKMNPVAQNKWNKYVSDTKDEIMKILPHMSLSDFWTKK